MAIFLSEQQRKRVEQNHNLIYGYAKMHNIAIEEHYDLLAIGLCKATFNYDDSKGEFSSLAYRCMKNELADYFRACNGKNRVPAEHIISYDAPTGSGEDGSNTTALETIADSRFTEDEVIQSQTYLNMLFLLNEREAKVARYIEKGMKESEIASIMKCSQQNINRIKCNIKKKLLPFLNVCQQKRNKQVS